MVIIVHNGLIVDVPDTLREAVESRIKETEEILKDVVDKHTRECLTVLLGLKGDYETLSMFEKADEVAKDCINIILSGKIPLDKNEEKKLLLSCYDTRARCGDFESFCYALEWKRPLEKQFYIPRMRIFKKFGMIQAFQDVADGKLDFLCINMPPRSGKLLSDDTPILTRRGWKNHGDLVVGDEVINNKGEFVKVQQVFPKDYAEYEVTFSNGEKIKCHGKHEWIVYDRSIRKETIRETEYMIGKLTDTKDKKPRFWTKCLKDMSEPIDIWIISIKPLKEKIQGNCIQVEGGVYLAGKQLVPTHNSTTGIFFIVFMACLYPDRAILGNGHSTSLTQSFYNEVLNICTNDEYRLKDIFPTIRIVNKSSEYSYLDFNSAKRFHTMMFKSVDGGTTGLAEASNLLYCDDLVKDVETANNPDRLEKLFYTYTSTIQDRKVQRKGKDGIYRPCPEIHINTPWSIHDVTSRLIRIYGDDGKNPRVRIISVPCYDDNGDSNFKYDYGKGFDVDYYKQLEASEDPVIFSAKYLMQPIERDGRPFTEDALSFYYDLPDDTPDRVVAYVDVAHGGDDYMSMPIGYVFGNEIYIEDILFVNHIDDDGTRPLVVNKILENRIERVGFEENNGGGLYAELIIGDLKRRGYRTNVTTHKAPTNRSKLDRILSCQSEIKGIATEFGTYRIFFKAKSIRADNKQYNDFMKNLYNWSQKEGTTQKHQHDRLLSPSIAIC